MAPSQTSIAALEDHWNSCPSPESPFRLFSWGQHIGFWVLDGDFTPNQPSNTAWFGLWLKHKSNHELSKQTHPIRKISSSWSATISKPSGPTLTGGGSVLRLRLPLAAEAAVAMMFGEGNWEERCCGGKRACVERAERERSKSRAKGQ